MASTPGTVMPSARLACFAKALSRWVMTAVGAVAAVLMLLETAVLFAGVVARYVLDAPLVWTDEIASMMFIWLAMLGAVLALHRNEHMRLTIVVNRVPPAWRAWLEAVALLVVCAFVAELLYPAIEHVQEQAIMTSPALELSDAYRVAAMPVGAALMLFYGLARLCQTASWRQILGAVVTVALIGGAFYLLQAPLMAMGNANLFVFFVVVIAACMMAGVPIAFAFGVATVSYLLLVTSMPISIVVSRMDEGMSSAILLSIPLFVLLGALLQLSGLAKTLIDFMAALIGHKRGGMEFVLLGGMFLVSGISGSKAADMAAVAPAILPEMEKRGAKSENLVALLAASGAMTETIPPSLVLIAIGAVCNVSIAALFDGGLVPALVATFAIGLVCWLKVRRETTLVPRTLVPRQKASIRMIGRTFLIALPALALPVLIRFAVVGGVATATEVSTVGVVYTVVVGLVMHFFMRHIAWRRLYPMLVDAAALSGAILLIIGTATAMAWALTQSGFSLRLVEQMRSVPGGSAGFLAISVVIFVVLGSLLEGIPAVVLFGPMLFPVARSLGIADVHYAMVMVLAMGIGLFAPPFGVGFYSACAIAKVSPDRVFTRVWPYMGALFVALIVVTCTPQLSIGFHS